MRAVDPVIESKLSDIRQHELAYDQERAGEPAWAYIAKNHNVSERNEASRSFRHHNTIAWRTLQHQFFPNLVNYVCMSRSSAHVHQTKTWIASCTFACLLPSNVTAPRTSLFRPGSASTSAITHTTNNLLDPYQGRRRTNPKEVADAENARHGRLAFSNDALASLAGSALGGLILDVITVEVIDGVKAEKLKTSGKSTVNRYLSLIRSILLRARDEWEWIDTRMQSDWSGRT